LYPTTPDEVLTPQFSSTDGAVLVDPSPLSAIASVLAFVALLETVTLPVTLPMLLGANATVSTAACPGLIVVPLPTPLTLKPVPLVPTDDTVTVVFPVFVRDTFELSELPTATFPKLTFVALAVTNRVSATAWPTSGMVTFVFDPLTISVSIPATVVVLVGVNFTLNVDVPPAANVNGTASPEVPNPVPWVETDEITALVDPEFDS
jgi:hypothetical protein